MSILIILFPFKETKPNKRNQKKKRKTIIPSPQKKRKRKDLELRLRVYRFFKPIMISLGAFSSLFGKKKKTGGAVQGV